MPRLKPPTAAELPADLRSIFDQTESYMGFVANDALTMALCPEILKTALPFMQAVYSEGRISFELKRLVAMMSSWAAGCQYCVAHTAHGAHRIGVTERKLAALPEFETSSEFTAAERAALRVARSAGQTPNAVTDAEFATLREWFDEPQIVELIAVIALFGFLNRWNASFATELEASPLRFARDHLGGIGWRVGDHAP